MGRDRSKVSPMCHHDAEWLDARAAETTPTPPEDEETDDDEGGETERVPAAA